MSTVRMCDGCGLIFPEGGKGTSIGTVTVMVEDSRGRTVPEQRNADFCEGCTNMGSRSPRVAIAIEGGNKTGDGPAVYADTVPQ